MLTALVPIFLVVGFVILVMLTRRLFDSEKGIQKRWQGARRHFVAVATALCAMVVLITLLQVLDLFEADLFTLAAFFSILQVSFTMFICLALVIVTSALFASKRDSIKR